jgi:hypothetical protein
MTDISLTIVTPIIDSIGDVKVDRLAGLGRFSAIPEKLLPRPLLAVPAVFLSDSSVAALTKSRRSRGWGVVQIGSFDYAQSRLIGFVFGQRGGGYIIIILSCKRFCAY